MLIKTKKNVAYSLEQPLSTVPLEPILAKRPPTTEDRTDIGRMWIDQVNEVPYILVSISNLGVARWVTFGGEYDSLETITGNTGGAVPGDVNDNINVIGTNVLTFDGNIANNTIEASLVNGTDGQLLIGGGAQPTWANLTSSDGSITIDNGPNSIDLTLVGIDGETFTGNTGDVVSPIAGNVNIVGDNVLTVDGDSTTGTLTASLVNGTDGQLLIGGGTNPTWANITSTDGSITIDNGPNSVDLRATGGGGGGGCSDFFHSFVVNDGFFVPTGVVVYKLGTNIAMTEVIDVGNNFFPGDGAGLPATYTVPSNGIYQFSISGTFNTIIPFPGIAVYRNNETDFTIGVPSNANPLANLLNVNNSFCHLHPFNAGDILTFGAISISNTVIFNLRISGMRVGDI